MDAGKAEHGFELVRVGQIGHQIFKRGLFFFVEIPKIVFPPFGIVGENTRIQAGLPNVKDTSAHGKPQTVTA